MSQQTTQRNNSQSSEEWASVDENIITPKVSEKKPKKAEKRQDKIKRIIKQIHEDSITEVMKDILLENKRLARDLENLRIQNTSLKRDHDTLTHALLRDRLSMFNSDLDL